MKDCNTNRFSNEYGFMLEFSEDALVWHHGFNGEVYTKRIPYECITEMKYSSYGGIQITTNKGWSDSMYIIEKNEILAAIESVRGKINKKTKKEITFIELSDEQKGFVAKNMEKRKKKPFMSKLMLALLMLLFVAISIGGAALCLNNKIFLGMWPLLGGVSILSLLASDRWKEISFRKFFVIFLICAMLIGGLVFGIASKSKSKWSQLTDEEQNQIRDNMHFYDDVKDAMDNYN